jgi:hypothetical protein
VQQALRETKAKLAQLQTAYQEATKPAVIADAASGLKTAIRSTPSGALITFGVDLVDLSPSEADNLITRLSALGALPGNSWRVSVVYPKGVAEAARMANLRTQSIKSLLVRSGAAANSVDVRVIETEQTTANFRRISVSLDR